jgi:nucleoside phosphorylase
MVSVGIASVCEANGVPCVILRVLSDNADESTSASFAAFVNPYKDPVAAAIAVGMVDRLAIKVP